MSVSRNRRLRKGEFVGALVGIGVGLLLLLQSPAILGQQQKAKSSEGQRSAPSGNDNTSDTFTKEDRARIGKRVLANPKVKASHKDHRLQVLRVTKGPVDDKPEGGSSSRRLADVIVYDHHTGRSEHVLFDTDREEVLKQETMSGVPSPGEDELEEAVRIITADPEHAKLLKAGGKITGGFLASAPPGAPAHNRYVMMQVLTPDRRTIERMVVVDLSEGTIASSN
jgi:hypothetical protein